MLLTFTSIYVRSASKSWISKFGTLMCYVASSFYFSTLCFVVRWSWTTFISCFAFLTNSFSCFNSSLLFCLTSFSTSLWLYLVWISLLLHFASLSTSYWLPMFVIGAVLWDGVAPTSLGVDNPLSCDSPNPTPLSTSAASANVQQITT